MANEITKVTDQNNVDHPLRDAAAQTALTGILNGQSIDSFGDVESALDEKFPRSEQAVLVAKNWLEIPKGTYTEYDVTIVIDDSGITLNGTCNATSRTKVNCQSFGFSVNAEAVGYKGVDVANNSSDDCYIWLNNPLGGGNINGKSWDVSTPQIVTGKLSIKGGVTYNNLKIKPMIVLASDTDLSTYASYAKTNRELTEDVAKLSGYLEQSVTLSTSGTTAVTFTDASITANSQIQYGCSTWGIIPDNITCSSGSCVVTMPKVASAATVTVRIYVR